MSCCSCLICFRLAWTVMWLAQTKTNLDRGACWSVTTDTRWVVSQQRHAYTMATGATVLDFASVSVLLYKMSAEQILSIQRFARVLETLLSSNFRYCLRTVTTRSSLVPTMLQWIPLPVPVLLQVSERVWSRSSKWETRSHPWQEMWGWWTVGWTKCWMSKYVVIFYRSFAVPRLGKTANSQPFYMF